MCCTQTLIKEKYYIYSYMLRIHSRLNQTKKADKLAFIWILWHADAKTKMGQLRYLLGKQYANSQL